MKTILLSVVTILSASAFMSSAQGVPLYQHQDAAEPQRDKEASDIVGENGMPSPQRMEPGSGVGPYPHLKPRHGIDTPTVPQLDRANPRLRPGYGTTTPTEPDGHGTGPTVPELDRANPQINPGDGVATPTRTIPGDAFNCDPAIAGCGPSGPDGNPAPSGPNPCHGPYCPPRIP